VKQSNLHRERGGTIRHGIGSVFREFREEKTIVADKYASFALLAQSEGKDAFSIRLRDKATALAVAAPHGGRIEPGTSEIALSIARDDLSYYLFEGNKDSNNANLHITSTRFDEPQCIKLLKSAATVMTIHGEATTSQTVFLGGRDKDTQHRLRQCLKKAGFDVRVHDNPELQGLNPTNICNIGHSGAGVQLELSRGLRETFFDALTKEGRERPSEHLTVFANAVREAIGGRFL